MKHSILGKNADAYAKELAKKRVFILSGFLVMAALNALLVAMRTEENHTVMLLCNILTDVIFGWCLLFYIGTEYLPKRARLRLQGKYRETYSGCIEKIEMDTEQFMSFACKRIKIGGRSFFLLEDTFTDLAAGDTVAISTVDSIVVEVEKNA